MLNGFDFENAGRKYSCSVEELKGPVKENWWWFTVSGDQQRYAPFRTTSADTRAQVQTKIVAFYESRLFAKSQPIQRGAHWGRKPDAVAAKKPA